MTEAQAFNELNGIDETKLSKEELLKHVVRYRVIVLSLLEKTK